jgi:hypothetical protein
MFQLSLRNSFLYQFSAINIFAVALLVAAFFQGWITQIYQGDTVHITSIIAITFFCGLGISIWKAIGLNRLWNQLYDNDDNFIWRLKGKTVEALSLRLSSKIQIVHLVSVLLLLMGIAGTMIGIILALKSTEAFAVSDQSSMVVAILLLFKGVYVKFYASLVGIIGHGWLYVNYHMLATKSRLILARMAEYV